jgi:uncharacterized membrane-anchored protein
MRWNRRPKVERPEYPKLVPIAGTKEEARDLLPALLESDPEAEIVEGGSRGVYARVHNESAETAARRFAEDRNFPLA